MRLTSPTSRTKYRLRLLPVDVLSAAAAPLLALWLRDPNLVGVADFPRGVPETYQYAAITFACALGSFLFFRLSDSVSRFFSVHDALLICGAVACTVAASSLMCFTFTRLEGVPRSTPFIYGLVLGGGLIFARLFCRLFSPDGPRYSVRAKRLDVRRVLLIGVDRFAAAAIRLTDCQQPRTTVVVAALDGQASSVGRKVCGVKIVGHAQDLDDVIDEYAVHGVALDEVWLSDDANLTREAVDRVRAVCDARHLPLVRVSEALGLLPPVSQSATAAYRGIELSDYFELKRALDILIATSLLIALLPVAPVVAFLVMVDVGAPVLFWQQRIGRNGRKFLLYKFRTYHAPFDRSGNRIAEADRLSRIGRAIRATRLDEIPQLYNVLIGDMSMVGPRPLLPHDQPSDPRIRLLVRPGITGWAQINGGAIIGPEEKDALDTWYIQRASFSLDLEILVNTILVALTGEKMNQFVVEDAVRWRDSAFSEPATAGQIPPPRYEAGEVRRRDHSPFSPSQAET
jgi:lipopolysaccharide/colanic/teichoic acid biosynthesis glycosyltransferase